MHYTHHIRFKHIDFRLVVSWKYTYIINMRYFRVIQIYFSNDVTSKQYHLKLMEGVCKQGQTFRSIRQKRNHIKSRNAILWNTRRHLYFCKYCFELISKQNNNIWADSFGFESSSFELFAHNCQQIKILIKFQESGRKSTLKLTNSPERHFLCFLLCMYD